MSSDIYQIVGECAYVSNDTPSGRTRILMYKGALVPGNAPELQHLLSTGLVAKVGGQEEMGGVNADGLTGSEAEQVGDDAPRRDADGVLTPSAAASDPGPALSASRTTTGDGGDSTEAKRAAARTKLPADGSAPDGRASKDVWVEYHVAQGGSYDDLVKQDKPDLVKLAEQRRK